MNKKRIINKIIKIIQTEDGANTFADLFWDNNKKRKYDAKYRQENKDKIKEYKRKYYLEHKEKIKETFLKYKEYEIDYKKWHAEANLRYYYRNRDKIRKYKAEYYENHKEQIKERIYKWRKTIKAEKQQKIKDLKSKVLDKINSLDDKSFLDFMKSIKIINNIFEGL